MVFYSITWLCSLQIILNCVIIIHFSKGISIYYNSKSIFFPFFELVAWSETFYFWLRVSISKRNFPFSNLGLVTRVKVKLFIFQLPVNNSRWIFLFLFFVFLWVTNSNWNLMFYEVKLVTQKNNVYKNKTFQVSNLGSHVIWRNSTLYSTL